MTALPPTTFITETPRQRHVRLHRLILAAGRVPQRTLTGCEQQARMLESGELPKLPPPSKAVLKAMANDRARHAHRDIDATSDHHSWANERAWQVDDAIELAVKRFLEPDGTPKKQPINTVTRLAEVGLDQALVSHDELVAFLGEERLDPHQRADAVRKLKARGMPISAGHDRTFTSRADALETFNTNPED